MIGPLIMHARPPHLVRPMRTTQTRSCFPHEGVTDVAELVTARTGQVAVRADRLSKVTC